MPTNFTHTDLAHALETQIRQNRLLDLPVAWQDEIIYPYYQGLSLRNIPHTIAAILGAPLPDSSPLFNEVWGATLPQAQRVVVYLIDGMGYQHLQMLIEEDSEIRQVVADLTGGRGAVPLTSVAPSTTAVALPTLWTGASPGATGMLGTILFLQEFSTIASLLSLKPMRGKYREDILTEWGLSEDELVAVSGLCEHLASQAIPSYLVIQHYLVGTGLSRILHRGLTKVYTHVGASDMFLRLEDALRATRGEKAYVSMYWGAVDAIAHGYGAHNRYTKEEIRSQLLKFHAVLQKPEVRDGQTLVMILADHGHYDVQHAINLVDDKLARPIKQALAFGMTGDNRLPLLHLRAGELERVQNYIQATYGDCLAAVDIDTALASGFYGIETFSPKARERLGDLVLIPRINWRVDDPSVSTFPLISWHGGLADWEMLIPFMWQMI